MGQIVFYTIMGVFVLFAFFIISTIIVAIFKESLEPTATELAHQQLELKRIPSRPTPKEIAIKKAKQELEDYFSKNPNVFNYGPLGDK